MRRRQAYALPQKEEKKSAPKTSAEVLTCCGKMFKNKAGLVIHKARMHGNLR